MLSRCESHQDQSVGEGLETTFEKREVTAYKAWGSLWDAGKECLGIVQDLLWIMGCLEEEQQAGKKRGIKVNWEGTSMEK